MATYTKATELLRAGEIKRAYIVHGESSLLTERYLDELRATIAPDDVNSVSLTGAAKIGDIFDHINTYPHRGRKLVVIRECEKIKDWKRLDPWMDARNIPNVTAAFVASGKILDNPPHVARITKTGRSVTTTPSDKEATELLAREAHLQAHNAQAVLEACGSLDAALKANDKAKLLGVLLTPQSATQLQTPTPSDDLVDALARLDKAHAAEAAALTDPTDTPRVLTFLATRVTHLHATHLAVRKKQSPRDIARDGTVPAFLLPRLLPAAKHYDAPHTARRLALISRIDADTQRGQCPGALQALIALW